MINIYKISQCGKLDSDRKYLFAEICWSVD